MSGSCPRTCGLCPTVTVTKDGGEESHGGSVFCADTDDRCEAWTAQDKRHCLASVEFMAGACAKTCGFCIEKEEEERGKSGGDHSRTDCAVGVYCLGLFIVFKFGYL